MESAGSSGAGPAGASGLGDGGAEDAGAGGEVESSCADLLSGMPASKWVFADAAGTLRYQPLDARGDRIVDFSYAGYRGGGEALPEIAASSELTPSGADDTARIQAAIDVVSKRALSAGIRGAVALSAGTFKVSATLHIGASGVVLRGAGSRAGGTAIDLTGTPHLFLSVLGAGSWSTSDTAHVVDTYLPAGSQALNVDDASLFNVGDRVLVDRPVTAAWVHLMGMDTLVRDGKPQTWIGVGTLLHADRRITAIAGKRLTLDAPLPDSYDAKYLSPPGATLSKYVFPGRISEVGVQGLRIVAPPTATPISEPQYQALTFGAVEDSWASDIALVNTVNSIALDATSKRITLQDLSLTRALPADGSAGYPLEITIGGSQILVQRSSMQGDAIYTYATGARATGPNVYLHATGSGVHNRAEPHQRWATGLLADHVTGEAINFYNRATAGSGHGWAIGWGVVWNSSATNLDIEQPPGAQNWAIGCTGKKAVSEVPGAYESLAAPVAPNSLYLAQLCARRGRSALKAIGY